MSNFERPIRRVGLRQQLFQLYGRNNWRRATALTISRIVDALTDIKDRVWCAGYVDIRSLVPVSADCNDYMPSTRRDLRRVLTDLQITPRDVFIDFGSGMGRALLIASEFPFKDIIGVEIVPHLMLASESNRKRLPPKQAARISLWGGMAQRYKIPNDASVFYFFNPFRGDTLRAVLDNIHQSVLETPRRLHIVFNNPLFFEAMLQDYDWLELTRTYNFEEKWIVATANVPATRERYSASDRYQN